MSLMKTWCEKMSLREGIATASISCVLLLAACGDDSSSGKGSGPAEDSDLVVATFDDLPVCGDKRDGATAYVKDEKAAYLCEDHVWTPDSGVDSHEKSSSSVKKSSSSVKNASSSSQKVKSSSSNKNNAKSSSSVKASSDSKEQKSSSSVKTSSSSTKPKVVVVKDKSISGVSQKGPFVTGSAVKLYELDGKTFAQTGKSFTGKITTDGGKFSVSSVTLASQYALLEANGYFRNEITGKKSSGTVTLNALTDLTDRKTVNINLLTHLEYERALYLVGKGENVSSAKKQAEAEILNAFGISGNFVNSEDLDIFSKGDGNAALLAFSVLMLHDLSEADLTELLTKFATDIEKDGRWDDETTKAKIADWAQVKDLVGGLASVRSNIEKWNLGTVPEFEKYVSNFWYTNYGLGECGTSNKAEVKATVNKRSNTYGTQTRYICKDGAWVEATVIEKDTYKWKSGEDGEIKTGDVTKTKKYDYDGKLKKWRDATTVEAALGGCTEAREKDISLNTGKVNGTWYICKSRVWESTNNITVDTQGWIKGSDGDLQKGDSTDVIYKYDEAQDKWLMATHNDTTLKLMGCTANRIGDIGKSSTDDTYYICKNMDWQKAQEIDYDTYGEKCTSAEVGKTIDGVVTSTNRFYCTANGWVKLTVDWSWGVPKEARLNPKIIYGTMTDTRDKMVYKTIKIGNQNWMAENLNFFDKSLNDRSWCYGTSDSSTTANCAVTGRLYTWAAAVDSAKLYKDKSIDCGYGKTCTLPDTVYGVCPPGWHLPTQIEWNALFTAVGGQSTAGKILKSQTGWNCNGNGTDEFGFSGLPAGEWMSFVGLFVDEGSDAFFWSASEDENISDRSDRAYFMQLNCASENAYLSSSYKRNAFSVRCLKN